MVNKKYRLFDETFCCSAKFSLETFASPVNAITWKNLSPTNRDRGIVGWLYWDPGYPGWSCCHVIAVIVEPTYCSFVISNKPKLDFFGVFCDDFKSRPNFLHVTHSAFVLRTVRLDIYCRPFRFRRIGA